MCVRWPSQGTKGLLDRPGKSLLARHARPVPAEALLLPTPCQQVGPGPTDHIELNSALLYTNSSCRPNLAFQIHTPGEPATPADWRVVALRPLQPGDVLSFFYPSTEFVMDRAFECRCQEEVGRAVVRLLPPGAQHTPG